MAHLVWGSEAAAANDSSISFIETKWLFTELRSENLDFASVLSARAPSLSEAKNKLESSASKLKG
eukprot:1732506-Amphidinium_carterae.1